MSTDEPNARMDGVEVWRLANPSLGCRVNEEAIAEFIAEDGS